MLYSTSCVSAIFNAEKNITSQLIRHRADCQGVLIFRVHIHKSLVFRYNVIRQIFSSNLIWTVNGLGLASKFQWEILKEYFVSHEKKSWQIALGKRGVKCCLKICSYGQWSYTQKLFTMSRWRKKIYLTNWRQFFMRLSCYWSWIS